MDKEGEIMPAPRSSYIVRPVVVCSYMILILCTSCGSRNMNVKDFTDSDACKALIRDIRFGDDSPIGKALKDETFSCDPSGDCSIETRRGLLIFNVRKGTFSVAHGIDPSGGEHEK